MTLRHAAGSDKFLEIKKKIQKKDAWFDL